MNLAEINFIQTHLTHNVANLALKHAGNEDIKPLLAQISARQKIRKKLPEWYLNPEIIFPPTLSLEQASSQATAKLKAQLIEGYHLLDITGGLGVDCYYMSRSFKKTTYVEMNPELEKIAAHNFEALKANIETFCGDGVQKLQNSMADVIYIDPYRRNNERNKVVALSECLPDVTSILPSVVKNGQRSLIKTSPMLDISRAMEELQYVHQVWVIGVKNDCKEVIYLLEDKISEHTLIKTFDINDDFTQTFEFDWAARQSAHINTAAPDTYLYEANSSIMKSGGQDLVALHFGLKKLHPDSHLFTSDEQVAGFPGKTFKIVDKLKPFDKTLKNGRFNVISRNFPAKASEIEKRLRLKPAHRDYLLATKTVDGKNHFFVCKML